jgi:hypothetical protein
MFPVTRQVRRKRTPVFGRPGRIRGSADENEESRGEPRRAEKRAEESGGACAQRVGPGEKQRGLEGEQGGLGEEARPAPGNAGLGSGGHEVPGQASASLAPGRSGRPSGTRPALLSGGTHPPRRRLGEKDPRPPGTNDAIRPAPPPSQKCRGRSAGTPILHGVRITRELRRTRTTSARPRTPRRCWREYARAH